MKKYIYLPMMVLFSYWSTNAQQAPPYNYQAPLFRSEQIQENGDYLRYSALTGYREGVKSVISSSDDSLNYTHRFYMYNYSRLQLCLNAWSEFFIQPNQIVLNVSDKSMYLYDVKYGNKSDWEQKNLLCYELTTPGSLHHQKIGKNKESWKVWYELMKSDVEERLGVVCARTVDEPIACLVLVNTGIGAGLRTKGGVKEVDISSAIKRFRNVPISDLLLILNSYSENPQVINETSYNGNIDLDLDVDSWTNIVAVKKALKRNGLDLQQAVRKLKVFTIREHKKI